MFPLKIFNSNATSIFYDAEPMKFFFLHRDLKEHIHAIIRVVVFSNPPENFKSAVKGFFSKAFKAHQTLSKNNELTLEEGSYNFRTRKYSCFC